MTYSGPEETDGVGACQPRIEECEAQGYRVVQEEVLPSEEVCDGVDNDCRGGTPAEEWSRTFGGPREDELHVAREMAGGGFILAGETRSHGAGAIDGWLIRTDAQGHEEWNRTFGGTGWDTIMSVQQTSDGGFILAGGTTPSSARSQDAWLIKVSPSGDEEWSRTFGGSGADWGLSVRQTSDGGFVLAGSTRSFGSGNYDAWLIKTDGRGNQEWQRLFGGSRSDEAQSIGLVNGGGFVLAGATDSLGPGSRDAWLIRTDASGNEVWNRTYGGAAGVDTCRAVQPIDDGFILAGSTQSFGAGGEDAWLIRVDAQGNEQWSRTFGGDRNDQALSVQATSGGGFTFAGRNGSRDAWLVGLDGAGNEQWQATFGGERWDRISSIRPVAAGGFVLAGDTESTGAGRTDAWLLKVCVE